MVRRLRFRCQEAHFWTRDEIEGYVKKEICPWNMKISISVWDRWLTFSVVEENSYEKRNIFTTLSANPQLLAARILQKQSSLGLILIVSQDNGMWSTRASRCLFGEKRTVFLRTG
jgi:hypothetical protein